MRQMTNIQALWESTKKSEEGGRFRSFVIENLDTGERQEVKVLKRSSAVKNFNESLGGYYNYHMSTPTPPKVGRYNSKHKDVRRITTIGETND